MMHFPFVLKLINIHRTMIMKFDRLVIGGPMVIISILHHDANKLYISRLQIYLPTDNSRYLKVYLKSLFKYI